MKAFLQEPHQLKYHPLDELLKPSSRSLLSSVIHTHLRPGDELLLLCLLIGSVVLGRVSIPVHPNPQPIISKPPGLIHFFARQERLSKTNKEQWPKQKQPKIRVRKSQIRNKRLNLRMRLGKNKTFSFIDNISS
jgi:hypothetical protein